MKNLKFLNTLLAITLLATMSLFIAGCDDDDEPSELTLTGLTAGSIDLNGATSPSDVPVSGSYTATFSTDVDATSVTADNIKLIRDYDDAEIPLTFATSGNTVTITPDETLGTGSLYILTLNGGLKSTGGKMLGETIERNFTTEGAFAPAGVVAHWTFEDSGDDVVGDFDPAEADVVDITYVDSRNDAAGKAASFNGNTSLIEIPGADALMANQDFGISFWVKPSTEQNGHFVLGLAGSKGFQWEIDGAAWDALNKSVKLATQYDLGATTGSEDTWWNGDGKTKDNGGWQGSTFNKDVSTSGVGTIFADKWTHVACSYDATAKVGSMYVNGEKVREWDFNLWPDGDAKRSAQGVTYAGNAAPANELAFGFIQARENVTLTDTWADYSNPDNNHFLGELDDVRIFSAPLTQTEVTLMYNSEKP